MIAKLGLIPLTIGLFFLGLGLWFFYWPTEPVHRLLGFFGFLAAARFGGFALLMLLLQGLVSLMLTLFQKRDTVRNKQ